MSNTTLKNLQNLFDRWEKKMNKDEFGSFFRDGIECKHSEEYDNVQEEQERYNKWDNATKKILFIAKDPNITNWGTSNGDQTKGASGFCDGNRRLDKYSKCRYLYITSFLEENKPEFDSIDMDKKHIIEFFKDFPYAWLNIKKSGGGSARIDAEIEKHLNDYGDLLLEEIEILKPDIIISLGSFYSPNIFNAPKLEEKLKEWKQAGKPILYNAYHPSAVGRGRGYKKMYESLIKIS